jgi:hypothetical protein
MTDGIHEIQVERLRRREREAIIGECVTTPQRYPICSDTLSKITVTTINQTS